MNTLIQKFDLSDMRSLILHFPDQVEEAITSGQHATIRLRSTGIRNVVVSGLGGSAIGGDLLRSYVSAECGVPIAVSRHYFLPDYVDDHSMVIISSYSGNTEETIASYKDAMKRKARILCISSGGTVAAIAAQHKHSIISIPGGLPPRAAIGYSFFPMLIAMSKIGLIKSQNKAMKETIGLLYHLSAVYGNIGSEANKALQLARTLHDCLPVIYASADRFDTIQLRWRGQIEENAKTLAYGNVFPELNHNEIVGWEVLKELMGKIHVIVLRDRDDHKRVARRMDITKNIIHGIPHSFTEVYSEGTSLLARLFSLLYLGDWVSYYLALLNGVDPTPVKKIDFLKNELAAIS